MDGAELLHAAHAIRRDDDRIALFFQIQAQKIRNVAVVLHDQNRFRHKYMSLSPGVQAESVPHVAFLPTLYPTFTDLLEHFVKETQKPHSPVAEGLRCCPVHGLQISGRSIDRTNLQV